MTAPSEISLRNLPGGDGRLRILTLAGQWHLGGPFAVNRELSIALAELGHHVTARLGTPTPPHPLVDIQGLDPIPGISDSRAHLLRSDGLPPDIDVILGHGRFSGGAATYLRDNFYPQAHVLHFVHVTPDEMDRLRGDPIQSNQHTETELRLVRRADLVLGLGPLLTDTAALLARMCNPQPRVAEVLPGVVLGPPPGYSTYQRRLNLLMFGRTDDELKGADIAAAAVGRLHEQGFPVRLTMLGALHGSVVEQERALSDIARMPIRVRPYTADHSLIEAEIRAADLAIHPAIHEDFGLAPLEVAGYGVPILVGGHTGVGMFLADPQRVPSELGGSSVLHVPHGRGQHVVDRWVDGITSALEDLPAARGRARKLRDHLGEHYTWQHAAAALVDQVRELPPRSVGVAVEQGGPRVQQIELRQVIRRSDLGLPPHPTLTPASATDRSSPGDSPSL
jgi:glycosyltransferase involved in cell wall biosynthesis